MLDAITEAIKLLSTFDQDVLSTVWISLYTTIIAVLIASFLAIPLGLSAGAFTFRGRRVVIIMMNTLMALPTVVIGLLVFSFLNRQGLLGGLGLMFTPWAMIIGQTVLAIPIIAHYTMSAAAGSDPRIARTVMTLGGSRYHFIRCLLFEIRFGVAAAIIAGFGRVIAEVGIAMMLGGNIRGYTRTMTTAIALETSKGEFAFGLALGLVLLLIALVVNLGLNVVQQKRVWRPV